MTNALLNYKIVKNNIWSRSRYVPIELKFSQNFIIN